MIASTSRGVAPLAVDFTVGSDQQITMVFGEFEPGASFFISPFSGAALIHTYQQPGVYTAVFNIVLASGTALTKQVQIGVQTAEQVDQQAREAWVGLSSALARGDKPAAMQHLTMTAQVRYGPVFDALMPSMAQILGSFSALQAATVDGEVAEYAVNRTINGVDRIFLFYFLRGADGVWRMESM